MLKSRRAIISIAVALALVAAVSVVVVRSVRAARLTPPEQAVQSLLELRAKNATDTALYERYVESTSVAAALSEDSVSKQGAGSPIPTWERPRVTKETSASTDVTVKWRPSDRFKDWPVSTVFVVALRNGRWVLIDAEESSKTASAESTKSAETTASPHKK